MNIVSRGTYSLRVVNPAPGGGLSGTRAFTVTTGTVASAEFIGVTTAVLAGSADGFAVRFRDSFGNLVDFPAPFVRFTDETGSSTGTIPLSRNSLGTSSATATTYTIDGNYRLWIDGISIHKRIKITMVHDKISSNVAQTLLSVQISSHFAAKGHRQGCLCHEA